MLSEEQRQFYRENGYVLAPRVFSAAEVEAPFPMHQDYHYFPHEKDTMIAAVIHVDDATVENGCLCVYPGSHRWGPVECEHEGSHHLSPDAYPIEKATPCTARAGDVLL